MDNLKEMIRTVPDFPKPGIMFYDITTLLKNPYGLRTTIDRLVELIDDPNIDTVIGIEARGAVEIPGVQEDVVGRELELFVVGRMEVSQSPRKLPEFTPSPPCE